MSYGGNLSGAVQLSPDSPQVDALVFAAAPDTQALSVSGAKYPDLVLDVGGVPLYNGSARDFVVDVDSDGYAVSVTTVEGGALDAGGAATATYKKAVFDVDDDSEGHHSNAQQTRYTIDGSLGGGCTANTQGSSDGGATWFDLGLPFAVAAADVRTRMIEEPVNMTRVQLSAVVGPIKVLVQENV